MKSTPTLKLTHAVVVSSALLWMALAPQAANGLDIPLSADATVASAAANVNLNYGGALTAQVIGASSNPRSCYLRFDLKIRSLVQVGGTGGNYEFADLADTFSPDEIEYAELRMYASAVTANGKFTVHQVTGPWIEGNKAGAAANPGGAAGELTHNNRPGYVATPEGEMPGNPVTTKIPAVYDTTNWPGKFISIDLTSLVRKWVRGLRNPSDPAGAQNFGVLLYPNDTTISVNFDSKEATATANRPTLHLTIVKKRVGAPLGDLSMGIFTTAP